MRERKTYAVWAATRLLMLVAIKLPKVGGHILFGDIGHYKTWSDGLLHWSHVPYRDFGWEYPPGAALVIGPPGAFGPGAYSGIFIGLMLLADLAMVVALHRLARRLGGSVAGVWIWIAGVALLGPVAFTRYDTVSSLLAVLALLAMAGGAGLLAGLALGGGVAMKLWPALLVLVVPFVRGVRRRLLLAAGATVAVFVIAVLAVGGARHGTEMFTHHTQRGLQVESIAATPLVVAGRFGADVHIAFHESSGSWDVLGHGVDGALAVTSVLSAAALLLIGLLWWRVRRDPSLWLDLAATSLLLLAVAGKVLSPQYELWLLALFAAALCYPGSRLRVPALLVVLSAALTQVVYPAYYLSLVRSDGLVVMFVLVARNAVLLAAAWLSVMRVAARRTATP